MIGDWDAGLVVARALSDGSGMGAVGRSLPHPVIKIRLQIGDRDAAIRGS